MPYESSLPPERSNTLELFFGSLGNACTDLSSRQEEILQLQGSVDFQNEGNSSSENRVNKGCNNRSLSEHYQCTH